MTVYLDSEYKCHLTDTGGLTAAETGTDFFDGKCAAFVEGYRFVPEGSAWTRPDGEVFAGAMLAPCRDSALIGAVQTQYETDSAEHAQTQAELADALAALAELGVT